MKIQRKRYVIMRNNRTEIFCGLARNYKFKSIDDIGDTAIKTYLSKAKALASFDSSWGDEYDVEAVEITETYDDENEANE